MTGIHGLMDGHVIRWSQGPMTLGHETMVASWVQVEKGREPLYLTE